MFASSGIAEHASVAIAVRNAFRNASDALREPLSCIFLFVSGDALADQASAAENRKCGRAERRRRGSAGCGFRVPRI